MTNHARFALVAAISLVLALAACSDDSPTGGGATDTTPPTVTSVTPVDAFHIDVTFNEAVTKASAEDAANYVITETGTPSPTATREGSRTPGDPMPILAAVLDPSQKTVIISTESSMAGLNYNLSITGVSDTHGNDITEPVTRIFTGSINGDETAPAIVSFSPVPNATNVAISAVVTAQFSEPVTYTSVADGASFKLNGVPVPYTLSNDGTSFTLTPDSPLELSKIYTVAFKGVQDNASNTMADTQWSFTTTSGTDHTSPTLVSSVPANFATHVDVNGNLSLTFSEAIDQNYFFIHLPFDIGPSTDTWSNDGKTFTMDPINPLADNRQYTLVIFPGFVRDLSGNGVATFNTVVFTTGSALESGSIAGTISGDPGSGAADPSGAVVIAANGDPLNSDVFDIFGSGIVAGNNTYSLLHLPDATYYPIAVMDSNHDGHFDPSTGDAVGVYGVTSMLDTIPESVTISGGNHATGINFALFDPSTVSGNVSYGGTHAEESHALFIGLFDTTGFTTSSPAVIGTEDSWPYPAGWRFSTFDGFPEDDYYVGAFLDANDNGDYDPLTDPAGLYVAGIYMQPAALHLFNGNDISGIIVHLSDPVPPSVTQNWSWPAAKHNAKFQRLCDAVRQAQLQASK